MSKKIIKISVLCVYVVMVATNYLAAMLPLGGQDTGQISENYPNLFAPAGYAFSIWGLIYALIGIYVIYQMRRKDDDLTLKVNRLFIVNALLNSSWLFAWHYNLIWLSVIIMAGLLITLIRIADIFRKKDLTLKESWLMRLPFSVYFGWITVATIANITVFLVYLGWNGFYLSDVFWTISVILIGALIGSWRMLRDRFVPYGLTLVWAYSAILAKHLSGGGFAGRYPEIISAVIVCLLVFVGIIFFIITKNNKK